MHRRAGKHDAEARSSGYRATHAGPNPGANGLGWSGLPVIRKNTSRPMGTAAFVRDAAAHNAIVHFLVRPVWPPTETIQPCSLMNINAAPARRVNRLGCDERVLTRRFSGRHGDSERREKQPLMVHACSYINLSALPCASVCVRRHLIDTPALRKPTSASDPMR